MNVSRESVLFITLDSCRYDVFSDLYSSGRLNTFSGIAPLHKASSPSYFTYGSHSAFWVGFTPGVADSKTPLLNPKVSKLFRLQYAGSSGKDADCFKLEGENIVEGFNRLGYLSIGTGAVDWFDPSSESGAVLGKPFRHFLFSGNTWSLERQLCWIDNHLSPNPASRPVFLFLNIGETHVPYWHEGARWPRRPSPCIPFGGEFCSEQESRRRQQECLAWVDQKLSSLIERFLDATIILCSDHGDCWGEDGLWEHGISHPRTLEVPLMIRFKGKAIA